MSMVSRTWSKREPYEDPAQFDVKAETTNVNNARRTKTMIGMTFATVTMRLNVVASLMPRRTNMKKSHKPTDEQAIATRVSPAPSAGVHFPSVDMMSTQ